MKQPRKHHYVPRCYLKYFATNHKNEFRVKVIDKDKNKPYIANIKDIAAEKDFNRIWDSEKEFYWEHFFSREVEPMIPKVLDNLIAVSNIINNRSIILNKSFKRELAKIICFQQLRTKKARKMQFRLGEKVATEVLTSVENELDKYLSTEQREYLNDFKYNENFHKEITFPIITSPERLDKFIEILLKKHWVLYKTPSSKKYSFLTSDNPVCMYNFSSKSTTYADNGLGVRETVIFFPVSKNLLIALYDPKTYFSLLKNVDGTLVVADSNFVMNINKLQYEQCLRQAYFSLDV